MPTTATNSRPAPSRSQHGLGRWLLFAVPILALVFAVAVGAAAEREATTAAGAGTPAPEFILPTTTGDVVELDDVLADGPALAYFSMGVGCDGCFAQIPEIDHALASRGIELLPVMVDPIDALAFEATRFGIERPILIDEDRSVSESYGMLGQFGHGDRPSHSFALISSDGTIERTEHYTTMFVPLEQLLDDFDIA